MAGSRSSEASTGRNGSTSNLLAVETPLEVTVLAPLLVVGYALVVVRYRPARGRRLAFAAALVLILAAFASPLERLALHDFLWAHLLQNVVLAEWAPALLVVAIPPALAARVHVPPLLALPAWLAIYFVWHLPLLYDGALRRPDTLLRFEHLTYLVAGVVLWWPVVHGRISSGVKAAYLFAAFVLASPLGLLLALFQRPIYETYKAAAPTWGLSALADQQIAGTTMAFEEAVVFFSVFAFFFLRFLREEQRAGSLDDLRPSRAR
jgi:cytochrome c oxidase assembly factor CtaG